MAAASSDSSSRGPRRSTRLAIATQRRAWTRRVDTWDRHNDAGMAKVAAAAIDTVDLRPGLTCVDLGCGGGRLALELARRGATVVGVDVSAAMVDRMLTLAREEGLTTVTGVVSPIEELRLDPESVDVVVSNYALHHLLDPDKARVVRAAYGWLRPGGQFINADMMLGRGTSAQDRQVIAGKVRAMAKKGIPGLWRIAKNAGRYLLRLRERPITPEAWSRLLREAGFTQVAARNVVAEANVVSGVKPTP